MSFGDSGPAIDASLDPAPTTPPGFSERGLDPDTGQPDDSCSDGLDNDNEGGIDCADRLSCGASAYCCVGSTESVCCADVPAAAVDFASCANVDGCGRVTDPFGSNPPLVEAGRFVPNGDGQDSGALLGDTVDGRTDILRLTATVEVPMGTCDCADAVAIGIGAAPVGQMRPTPDVAVMTRRAYGDVALVVDGEVIWTERYAASDAPAGPAATDLFLTLDLEPSGALRLTVVDGPEGVTRRASATWNPRAGRRALLYGRTPNRSEHPEHTAIKAAQLTASRCEIPSALLRSPDPAPVSGAEPSIASHGGEVWMATAGDGQIAFHHQEGDAWVAVSSTPLEGSALSNPELTVEDDNLVLYAEDASGAASAIVRYERSPEGVWGSPTTLALPDGSWGQPSVLGPDAEWVAALDRRSGELAVFRHNATESVYLLFHSLRPSGNHANFDQDEVADPELVRDSDGLIRLYYAGRRGTRWAIGMQLSSNGSVWRAPGRAGEALLSSSGAGHDALGVRGPAVWTEGGLLSLYHTAFDGLAWSVGRAAGAMP